MCNATTRLAGLMLAATLSTAALDVEPAASAEPRPAWTHQLPTLTCVPLAPSNGCLTTQALDLRGVQYFRVSFQAMNFGLGPEAPSVVKLRDANNMAAACFGAVCPTLTVPFNVPPNGSCCMPVHRSILMLIPPSQRRADVRLRVEVTGGYFSYAGTGGPPIIQFYTN